MTIPSIASELAARQFNPNVRAITQEALNQPEFADVSVIYTYASMAKSDHRNGRCVDFMIYHTDRAMSPAQRHAMGTRIRDYFLRHAVRLNVQGVIFDRHVYGFPGTRELNTGPGPHGTYRGPAGVARPYGGPNPHTDHVHVQFNGAPARAFLTNTQEDQNMPTPEELWKWDHIEAPDYVSEEAKKKNPTWGPQSFLRETAEEAHGARYAADKAGKKVDALDDKVDALAADVAKLVAALTAPTTTPDKKV